VRFLFRLKPHYARGVGVLPVMAYTKGHRPKGVPFLGFMYMKGYSLKYMIRIGNSVIWVCERAQRAEQKNFMAL